MSTLLGDVYYGLQMAGTIVFAVTGVIAAGRKSMDLMGAVFLAFVTANFGGTIRDLMLGAAPVFWVGQPSYLLASVGTGVVFFFLLQWVKPNGSLLLAADAVGMGVFTVAGADKSLALGFSPVIAITLGMVTGVGGGMVRDVLCGEAPLIFRREIYATAALAGAAGFVLLRRAGAPYAACLILGAALAIGLRLFSLRMDLHLPRLRRRR